jgi:hypothetical protein
MMFGYLMAFVFIFPIFSAHRTIEQMKMETWATYAGSIQAKVFFQEGYYRLLKLYPINKIDGSDFASKFMGQNEGAFAIWTRPVYKDKNSNFLWKWLNEDNSDQEFVESFNKRMKQLWNEKQKSLQLNSILETNNSPPIH